MSVQKPSATRPPSSSVTVYLIGVPTTGKTTLIQALTTRLHRENPSLDIAVIEEVARELVLQGDVTHKDIGAGTDEAMRLQKQILDTQWNRERQVSTSADVVLADRSGLDPIAFATKYGGRSSGRDLLELTAWTDLRRSMQRGLVILCEPVAEWFADDGVRVVPTTETEVWELHGIFSDLLHAQGIDYEVLPASVKNLTARTDFVVRRWEWLRYTRQHRYGDE